MTTPDTSQPRITGNAVTDTPRPARVFQSMAFTPTACTSTSTSPGPATGSGTSTACSTCGDPKRSITTARIAESAAIGYSPPLAGRVATPRPAASWNSVIPPGSQG